MLDASIIEPVEELEWIIPIVVQEKNASGEVRIFVNLSKLNELLLVLNISITNFLNSTLMIGRSLGS